MSSEGRGEPSVVGRNRSSPAQSIPQALELERLVTERLAALRARIDRHSPAPGSVSVVAVTKGFGPLAVRAALLAGLSAIGENYAGELLDKAASLAGSVGPAPPVTAPPGTAPPGTAPKVIGQGGAVPAFSWHFLGAIQRNKIGRLAPVVDCWQSVTREVEVDAILRAAAGRARAVELLVEVESTGLLSRRGVVPSEVPRFVAGLASRGVRVAGLMTVAPPGGGAPAVAAFRLVTQLADDLGLEQRSMGMSDDLDEALESGSTMVRIGRGLFGARP